MSTNCYIGGKHVESLSVREYQYGINIMHNYIIMYAPSSNQSVVFRGLTVSMSARRVANRNICRSAHAIKRTVTLGGRRRSFNAGDAHSRCMQIDRRKCPHIQTRSHASTHTHTRMIAVGGRLFTLCSLTEDAVETVFSREQRFFFCKVTVVIVIDKDNA